MLSLACYSFHIQFVQAFSSPVLYLSKPNKTIIFWLIQKHSNSQTYVLNELMIRWSDYQNGYAMHNYIVLDLHSFIEPLQISKGKKPTSLQIYDEKLSPWTKKRWAMMVMMTTATKTMVIFEDQGGNGSASDDDNDEVIVCRSRARP